MSEPRNQFFQLMADAASSGSFRLTAAGGTVAGLADWLLSSHGLAVMGLLVAVLGFLFNLWQGIHARRMAARKDAREQAEFEERLKVIRASRGLP